LCDSGAVGLLLCERTVLGVTREGRGGVKGEDGGVLSGVRGDKGGDQGGDKGE
jgi:hypothetical protein